MRGRDIAMVIIVLAIMLSGISLISYYISLPRCPEKTTVEVEKKRTIVLKPLTFFSVFQDNWGANNDDRMVQYGIDVNPVMTAYKKSLYPNEPTPKVLVFIAYTNYPQQKLGKSTCRVSCPTDIKMEVQLFIKDKNNNYVILRNIFRETTNFVLPSLDTTDEIIAVGKITVPDGRLVNLNNIVSLRLLN